MRPSDVFEDVCNLMRFGSTISNIAELDGVSTITTDNLYSLKNGMLVELGNRVYQVSNVTTVSYGVYSFDVTASNLTATDWILALYFDFGQALEIEATLKDQKDDPVNKNKRFPLMWLLNDITEDYNFEIGYESDITIAFVYLSERNLKSQKRIDTKLEPILDPLVDLFKETITKGLGKYHFIRPLGTNLDLRKSDKFLYGSLNNNRHIFADIADAIQLDFTIRFRVLNNLCTN